jgi:hypothetical protein
MRQAGLTTVPILAIVLPLHIGLAIALFLPAILLPFALRTGRPVDESHNRLVRSLLRLQGRGGAILASAVAITGILLVLVLGLRIGDQPWLVLALAIYAVDLAIAFFIQRPELRALVGDRAAWDDRVWQARARRQRYVSYAMAGLIGFIAFLMSTKPQL